MPKTAPRHSKVARAIQIDLPENQRVAAYRAYYGGLARLREEFHRTGRFDDANVKLDEIVKLLVIRFHETRRFAEGKPDRFRPGYLERFAEEHFGDRRRFARALRALSEEILTGPAYSNPDGTSVFGSHPILNIQPADDEFARRIVQEVRLLTPERGPAEGDLFGQLDILNESFGHFVRDTFHNTKADAQYMTPAEVVTAMTEMAFSDIEREREEVQRILHPAEQTAYLVLDPTCGVGSFVVQALRRMIRLAESKFQAEALASLAGELRDRCIYGQDKVDRMVRLAKVNLLLFGHGVASVWQGNSILGQSAIDSLQGKVDLILTNPPFGAEYDAEELLRTSPPERYPMLHELRESGRLPRTVDSEIILLDRCLSLLRPRGRLVIVLPDKVISAKGVEAAVREWVGRHARLKAVVELPAVTFAQAGTRTKTCFVYLQKHPAAYRDSANSRTYMSVCEDTGFEVVERVGAPVKVPSGTNELHSIAATYRDTTEEGASGDAPYLVVSEEPSAVWVRKDAFINGRWTPSFYHASRLKAVAELEVLKDSGFELHPLASVARLCSKERKRAAMASDAKVISVLHVSTDGTIDLKEVEQYAPKTSGLNCTPGEILFSKINPRIPRIAVVPRIGVPLACSTEFEILLPRKDLDPYLLAALLRSRPIQEQVRYLTSGTSSSHNRIKDSELGDILVPLPKKGSPLAGKFAEVGETLRASIEARYRADLGLVSKFEELQSLLDSVGGKILISKKRDKRH